MRHSLLAFASLALAACTADTETNEPASEVSDESALTSARTVHAGRVELLGSYRYRALYAVETAAGRELRAVALTGGERTLATFPAQTNVSLQESGDEGSFVVRHEGGIGIANLKATTPTWTEATTMADVAHTSLRGGTMVFVVRSSLFQQDVYVRTADGTTRQAPGTVWADSYRISPDGKQVAYSSGHEISLFSTATGKTVTALGNVLLDDFDFVNGTLLYSAAPDGELRKLDAFGSTHFYGSGVWATGFEWFLRPDGKIYAATHAESADRTHADLVDATTGEGTYFEYQTNAAHPHYLHFRSLESKDRRWLVDYYPSSGTSLSGDVWVHDLHASPKIVSRKVATGIELGYRTQSGGVGFGLGAQLGARCGFLDGGFVRCTKNDADREGQQLALEATSVSCAVSPANVSCTNGDGSVAGSAAERASRVTGSTWFNGRFFFEEVVGGQRRLSLLDPKTGGREQVIEHACTDRSFQVSTTANRVFVADCLGLHIAR